ncbi:hypothetical protein [Pseudorhodobacter ferrugineus]|uniref:hypothetical protein n=1 Tax=Pseudorhodobacter ferrugineus TaxID=77008 RepID=UPI0003B4ECA0|nr:hypothetical protein [Pseudorhodobacter ferrugineus]
MVTVSESYGVDPPTGALILHALHDNPKITSVYSIGGGNRAILDAFDLAGRTIDVFAAHDLDRTNTELLKSDQGSFVIHHSFRHDARQVALHFSKQFRLINPSTEIEKAEINIACPIASGV